MTTEAQRKAAAKYDKAHTKGLYLKLNLATDEDIIEHLNRKDNVQGYIKGLIRNDMEGTKMRYFLVDNAISTHSEVYDQELKANTAEEAIAIAKAEWERLTKSEQAKRDGFFLLELNDAEYKEAAEEMLWSEYGKEIWSAK